MKEYERLTDRNDLYWALQETKLSAETGIYLTDCLNLLALLEDKIENGTLVELPCKVGDKVYVFNRKYEICEMEVISFMLTNKFKEFYVVVDNPDEHYGYSLYASKLNEDWFLTKAEAEKKLKELQQ